MGNLAQIWQRLGDFKTALKLYNEVKNTLEKLGDKGGIADILHNIGAIHQDQGNFQSAVKLYQQSLEIAKELEDKSGIASTLHMLGNIHFQQGNYQEATNLYLQSLKIAEELGDKSGIASTLGQLGRIHEENENNFPAALEKYFIAFSIFEKLKAPQSKTAENDIARLREKMGEEAFNKAFEEFRRKHDT